MTSYFVVANETLESEVLLGRIRQLPAGSAVHLVVPATAPSAQHSALTHAEHLAPRPGETPGRALARWRLEHVLDQLRSEGLEVTGEVGDPNPVGALIDAMMASTPDEVIVATWPRGRSLWWGRDQLPARIRRLVGMPVTHIEVGQKAGRRRSVTGHSTAALVVLGRH